MKKKLVAALLAAVMVFSLAACSSSSSSSDSDSDDTEAEEEEEEDEDDDSEEVDTSDLEAITLIGGDNASVGAAAAEYGELFSETLEELSGGLITVNYQANGSLGDDASMQQQVLDGDMDFVICQTAQTTSFVSEVAIFDLPMVFAKYDAETIGTVLNDSDFSDALKECYENNNLKLIHFLQAGTFRETTSNVAVYELADFEGLQIRTMENSNHMAFWTALGAEPTPMTWSEVYFALQTGSLEAQENATDTCAGNSLYEVQDYLILTHHILYCNQLMFNNELFDSLPEQYQEWILEAAETAAETVEADMVTLDEESTQTLVDGGMEVIEFDESFIDEVLAVEGVIELYDDIDDQVGGGLVEMLQTALEETAGE